MKKTTPTCCDYAKLFIELRYKEYYTKNPNYFFDTKPGWSVRGCNYDPDDWDFYSEVRQKCFVLEIHFCPKCGKELPNIRLKKKIPKKVMTITDGGYYCDTCKERLMCCQCTKPEELWELE